jgi:tripartite ATP-independent transporter DctP family solute receptor
MKKSTLKLLSSIFILTMFTLLIGCSSGGQQTNVNSSNEQQPENKEEITKPSFSFKLAEIHSGDYPTVVGDKDFAARVSEATNNRINVEVYEGGALGDERTIIEQLQLGVIDMARVNTAPLSEFYEDIGVFSLPYLFADMDEAVDILTGSVGEEMLVGLEENRLVGLGYQFSGDRNLYNTKKPIRTLEDLKGMKIRVQESELWIDLMKELGASPTPVAFSEVYSALQSGVVDGAENIMSSYFSTNHFEVAGYYTLNRHTQGVEVLLISKKVWDELSAEDQEILKEAANASMQVQIEAQKQYDLDAESKVVEGGAEIIELSPEEFEKFQEAGKKVYEKYGEKYKDWLEKIENAK